MVYNWPKIVQRFRLSAPCRLCRASTRTACGICDACLPDLPWTGRACRLCAAPLPLTAKHVSGGPPAGDDPVCARCRKKPPILDACQALFQYRYPVDGWIRRLKFEQDLGLARLLAHFLAPAVLARAHDRIVPVPLHPTRLRQRGFNQSLEVVRPLKRRGLSVDTGCCRRVRPTPAQSGLTAQERRHNLTGAFQVCQRLGGESVLLIDDVMTTGSTLNSLARCLKRAGAGRVEAMLVARTPGP
ncbi:MAG TPA: ComF family protein [Gammaproteobacteria bacterium]|nr:ComF family protein [Gammaproteobacteria bacterium]